MQLNAVKTKAMRKAQIKCNKLAAIAAIVVVAAVDVVVVAAVAGFN